MAERTVTVKGRASMGEFNAAMGMSGRSARQFAEELKKTSTALQLEAAEAKKAAASASAESRERAKAARAASMEAREKTAAARASGTAEAKADAAAAKARAVEARAASNSAKDRAAAAKETETLSAAAAQAAEKDVAATAKASKAHQDAVAATSRHAMILGGLLVGAFGLAAHATLGFDAQMSAVGAASSATGADLNALRDAAISAGQATVFGATDAARAEEELAKAGVSVHDVLTGGLIGALNLATAGNLDLGTAAEIAASTMTQFKLAGKDIPHIADLLAAGAGKAQGSVEDLGLAMTYVGPVAAQMGVSVEETTGTLAELASNGVLAEKAGTGLRGVLMALTSPSAKASEVMQQLGINVYDAHGKFVGFRGVAEQLHRSLGGLTAQERDTALGQIFGNEQIVAARVLYAGGAQAVDDWTKKVNDSGYAARVAATRMDNLAGDIEQLKGSLETALIGGGTKATGALRDLTQAATGAVNAFSNLSPAVQGTITWTTAAAGAVLLAAGAYGTITPKIRVARAELEASGRAGATAAKGLGLLGKLGTAAAVLGVVAVGVQALSDKLNHIPDPALVAQHFSDLFVEVAAGKAPVTELVDVIGKASVAIEAGGTAAKLGRSGIADLDKQMSDFARGSPKAAQAVMAHLTDALTAQGYTTEQVAAMFPQYAGALKAASAEATLAADSTGDLSEKTEDVNASVTTYVSLMAGSKTTTDSLTESVKAAADQLGEFNNEYDMLIGHNLDATLAEVNFKQALADARDELRKNKGSLDDNTDAGRANIKTLGDLAGQADTVAQAVLKQTGSTDEATLAYWRHIASVRQLAIDSGISAGKVDGLLGEILGVGAAKVKPTIDANVASALTKIASVRTALANVRDKTVVYRFVADTSSFRPPNQGPFVASAGAGGAIIGRDSKPRTDPRDNYLLWARKGEALITPEARQAYGLTNSVVDAMNAGRAVSVASGGSAPTSPAGAGAGGGGQATPAQIRAAVQAGAAAGTAQALAGSMLRLEPRAAEVIARIVRRGEQSLSGLG